MAGNSGRLSRRPQDTAAQSAQAALDGAVAAFLDLDNRQSYVADALAALIELNEGFDPDGSVHAALTTLQRQWSTIAQQCLDATGHYLNVSAQYSPTDRLERPTNVSPIAAQAAFTQVHRELADAATAVDGFYSRHSRRLEDARAQRASVPRFVETARQAAAGAEERLRGAETEGVLYPSVLAAADQLIAALAALNGAGSSPAQLRKHAEAVNEAVALIDTRLAAARQLLPSVRGSLTSVRTRIQVVTGRLESLPQTWSALLREFAVASSRDLTGADDRARAALADAERDWQAAREAMDRGEPEMVAEKLTAARSDLSTAEAAHAALTDRLRRLRATREDPKAAAKSTRFTLRDAQLLVVGRGLVKEWGSVLDAQLARIERAEADLVGPHPDYWAYLQTLKSVETFVKGVVDKVRAGSR